MGQTGKAYAAINLRALELIREAFDRAGITQEALEERSGVPRSTIANIVSPTGTPRALNVDTFTRLAMGLGVDVGEWAAQLETVARRDHAIAAVIPIDPPDHTANGPLLKSAARRTGRKPSGRLDQGD